MSPQMLPSGLVNNHLHTIQIWPKQMPYNADQNQRFSTLVETIQQSVHGGSFHPGPTFIDTHDRCLLDGLGNPSMTPHNSGHVATFPETVAHQFSGTVCGLQHVLPLPVLDQEQDHEGNEEQCCLHALYKSTGRSLIQFPMHQSHETMELVYPTQ